jgi:hypothetical protein
MDATKSSPCSNSDQHLSEKHGAQSFPHVLGFAVESGKALQMHHLFDLGKCVISSKPGKSAMVYVGSILGPVNMSRVWVSPSEPEYREQSKLCAPHSGGIYHLTSSPIEGDMTTDQSSSHSIRIGVKSALER